MSWFFPRWDPDFTTRYSRTEVREAGGWFYQIRDPNGAHSTIFVPDMTAWANAIGHGVVMAERAAQPVAVAADLTRVRHVKQPIPGPKT